MSMNMSYDQIKILEVEVRSYSDEGYKVRYDFEKRLISWRDFYMWNNNFMKSLTDSKLEILSKRLPESHILECLENYNKGKADPKNTLRRPGKWEITVEFNDAVRIKCSDADLFPVEWIELRSIIESTTECTFRLH